MAAVVVMVASRIWININVIIITILHKFEISLTLLLILQMYHISIDINIAMESHTLTTYRQLTFNGFSTHVCTFISFLFIPFCYRGIMCSMMWWGFIDHFHTYTWNFYWFFFFFFFYFLFLEITIILLVKYFL